MQKTLYIRLLCVCVFLSVRESVLLCVKKLKFNVVDLKILLECHNTHALKATKN